MTNKLAYVILSLVVLVTAWAIAQLPKVSFDYDFENFFPDGHPELAYYLEFREHFENDNDYLLVGLIRSEGIFQSAFLAEANRLAKAMEGLPFVEGVFSLTKLRQPIIGPLGVTQVPVLRWQNSEQLAIGAKKLANAQTPPAHFVSKSGDALVILIKNKQQIEKEEGDILSSALFDLLESSSVERFFVAGKAYAQGAFVEAMQGDLGFYLSMSGVLVVLLLWLTYRQFFGIWIPLVVVGLAVIWLIGLMAASGKALDILSVILPNIMFVIGMSDVVHIMTKYLEELRLGATKNEALRTSYWEVGRATFLTSLTTSIGFLSLGLSNIQPIRELGLYSAAGVWIAFVLAFSLLPAMLFLLPVPRVARERAKFNWKGAMQGFFLWSLRKRPIVLIASLLLMAFSWFGIQQMRISTYLIDDIPLDSPLKKAFLFFDQEFGGSKPFEMSLQARQEGTVWEKDFLLELEKLHAYLEQEFGVAALFSPLTLAKGLHMANSGGRPEQFRLPSTDNEWLQLERNQRRFRERDSPFPILSELPNYARLTARMPDIGSELALQKVEALNSWMHENLNENVILARVTGTSFLIDINNELMAFSTMQGLAVALLAIALLSALLFRSWRMSMLAILPNLLPIAVVAGIMGVLGIPLKLSTAIIFAISFGIVVDDSIHFLTKLNIELRKGSPFLLAIRRTYLSAGKAIVITSLILFSGFVSLMFSSFSGVFAIGLLVCITLLMAVLLDLTLLPVLLSFLAKRLSKK